MAVFYALKFILFDTCYTAISVGNNSQTPELTSADDERTSLNGYQITISIAGTLSAIIFATVLGWYIEDVLQLYIYLGIGLGFAVWIFANLAPRVQANHKMYHKQFSEYPLERKALIPGVW